MTIAKSPAHYLRAPVLVILVALAVFSLACSDKSASNARTPAAGGVAVNVSAPRALHLAPAPDRRLIVADAGTGKDDGRILAITVADAPGADGELAATKVEVLMGGLPSRKQGDTVAGAQAGGSGRDGVVCAAIGKATDDAGRPVAGFAAVRCSDGKTFDLRGAEDAQDPDGNGPASDPSDIYFNGQDSWFVSDRAANVVWRIGPDGSINVQTVFADVAEIAAGIAAAPSGLHVTINARGQASVAVALAGGAIAGFAPGPVDKPIIFAQEGTPIGLWDDGKTTLVLLRGEGAKDGSVFNVTLATTVAAALARPAGFTRLDDGRLVVSEAGRLRVITPK